MAAFMNNRSISLMSGDGPHNNAHPMTTTSLMNAMTDTRTPARSNGGSTDNSPLQMFVKAKKKINDIYVEIEEYVRDVVEYMAALEADEQIVDKHNVQEVCAYVAKVKGIRDVLLRDHMKVAFFGRTSNGKSTVINAMLRDKILPSGIGHTTNCFLQVEGSDSHEAYLVTEAAPEERLPVRSVGQLAHALCKEKLSESQLVRIYWPRDKCLLLRDDVVFVDSPGVDVTPNLDEWIDKHCLDADVFVLVANAESTLMVTEKNFFHKVSAKLSKPNIFILNNRWDASASEPEYLDQVRRQHQERALDFLVRELQVCEAAEADERIFFISAKEVLQARLLEQGSVPQSPGASAPQLAEGFQTRYFEFQDFERKFEECISKSAVRTKFEQHAGRGRAIAAALRGSLDEVLEQAGRARATRTEEKQQVRDTLEETERGVASATQHAKDMISRMVEDVEQRVSRALNEEIRRLAVLVDEFSVPFHPEPLVLNVYKRELHAHVEQGLGSNLRGRLSTALATNVEQGQKDMLARMEKLLSGPHRPTAAVRAARPFELLYRLNCDNLCADFHEDLEFRFTWGITALIQRYCSGAKANKLALKNGHRVTDTEVDRPLSSQPSTSQEGAIVYTSGARGGAPLMPGLDEWSLLSRVAVLGCSGGTQGTFGGLLVGGFLIKTVGWRLIMLTGAVYGCLYMYERLTWTSKAKERQFKRQYVEHATKKLRLIVDLTSANCSHQVQQELSGTFARLCHAVDEATAEMSDRLRTLERDIGQLEEASATARVLRNKAAYLTHELDLFEDAYLRGTGGSLANT